MSIPTSSYAAPGVNGYTGEPNGYTHTPDPKPKGPPIILFNDAVNTAFGAAMLDASAAHDARVTGKPRGPVTGFRMLDIELGGAFAPGLHSINGDPGTGKTGFGLQVAASCRFPAIFVTCEMAPAELLRRHTARVTNEYLGRFKSGETPPERARELYLRAMAAAPMLAMLDGTREAVSAAYIQEQARAHMVRYEAKTLLIVVDSLHSWAASLAPDGANEYESINTALNSLRRISHQLNVPILYIAERNRESTARGDGSQNSGAGSRKIEYGAETVLSLMCKPDAEPDGDGEKPIVLKIAKNRHGAANKPINLSYNGALQRFSSR